MAPWTDPDKMLPDEKEEVSVRVQGQIRHRWYRLQHRWYAVEDLDRWVMRTSPYWSQDRSWYLRTDEIEAWQSLQDSS